MLFSKRWPNLLPGLLYTIKEEFVNKEEVSTVKMCIKRILIQ